MQKREVEQILSRQPFVPLRIVKTDGTSIDVPFQHVAEPLSGRVLIFKGVKREGSRVATGFDEITYEQIDRIVPRAVRDGRRRRKAS
jgi:hypothetical protein